MRKVFLCILFVLLSLTTSFSLYSSDSVQPLVSSIYEISDDVSLLAMTQPSSFAWRVVNGVVQRQDGFGTWQVANGGLNEFLNDYGIEPLSSVDILTALQTYGGQLGTGGAWWTALPILNDTGGVFTGSSFSLADLTAYGFRGLGKDLMGTSGSVTYAFRSAGVGGVLTRTFSSLGSLLGGMFSDYSYMATSAPNSLFLNSNGLTTTLAGSYGMADMLRVNMTGLAAVLRGSSGNIASFDVLSSSDLEQTTPFQANNLLDAIVGGFSTLQPDLAKLRYTLASDDDIQMREDMQEQYDSVVDNFTSPGGSVPSASDIADMAGISKGFGSTFSTSANPSDAFSQLGDSSNYSFFSSQTQNQLNPFLNSRSYFLEDDFVDYVPERFCHIFGGVGSSW